MARGNAEELTFEDLRWVNQRAEDFEQAWKAGLRPEIERNLAEVREPRRTALLKELILLEWELRQSLQSERPRPSEFVARFPELADWIETELPNPAPVHGLSTTVSMPTNPAPVHGLSTTVSMPTDPGVAEDPFPNLGGYELLKRIGGGAMGLVYLGHKRHAAVHHPVAVKTMQSGLFSSKAAVEKFLDEMRALENLQHPHIVQILDCGLCEDGRPFYVMQCASCSLAQVLAERKRLEPRAAAECVHTIAQAIGYLHDKEIVHRDLKPANILLNDSGWLLVADFGLAKMLAGQPRDDPQRHIEGTIPYMSPEQAEGRELESLDAGRRSDLWSLGVILFELLTGQRPFRGQRRAEILNKIQQQEPPLPRQLCRDIPRDLQRIVLKCLEKAPEHRYASTNELIEDLDRFLRCEPLLHATPDRGWERLERWARRKPALATRLGVAAGCSAIMWLYPAIAGESPLPFGDHRAGQFPYRSDLELRWFNQGLFLLWMIGSWIFQHCFDRTGWREWLRRGWLTVDILVLSSLILINDGLNSPMPVAFAVLIGASGLWFHLPTVIYTTASAVAAHVALLAIQAFGGWGSAEPPHKFQAYFLFALLTLGVIVGYQVRGFRALNRLYEQRPKL